MRERPILFSGEMVRSILDGRKTVTRRVIKRLAGFGPITDFQISTTKGYDFEFRNKRKLWNSVLRGRVVGACPYGQPGDRLWVRETFCHLYDMDTPPYFDESRAKTYYAATDETPTLMDGDGFTVYRKDGAERSPWKPSIHMPRKYSRITLEITSVRVERLKEISEEDSRAEGIEWTEGGPLHAHLSFDDGHFNFPNAKKAYRFLWERIKGAGSWDLNPYVWVVGFKRVNS